MPPARAALPLSYELWQNLSEKRADYLGAQQGIDIISKAMLRYGCFVEKPTFYGAAVHFCPVGGKLMEIPLEEDGMDMVILEKFPQAVSSAFYLYDGILSDPDRHFLFHGEKTPPARAGRKYDTYIIEEDDFTISIMIRSRLFP